MKKNLCLFGAIVLFLSSCSSDDNSVLENNSILPKTVSYTYPEFPLENTVSKINYEGNKIVSIVDLYSKQTFTYNGNLIVKQEVFNVYEGSQTKIKEVLYTYENGKLITKTLRRGFTSAYPDGQYIYKTVYTHTSAALISYVYYTINADTKAQTKNSEGNLTYKNGNLVVQQQIANGNTETRTYEYDNKNNPLKNIIGFDLLLDEISDFSINNSVKTLRTSTDYPNPVSYISSYVYNNDAYPIKQTSFTGGGSIEYEVEYTY